MLLVALLGALLGALLAVTAPPFGAFATLLGVATALGALVSGELRFIPVAILGGLTVDVVSRLVGGRRRVALAGAGACAVGDHRDGGDARGHDRAWLELDAGDRCRPGEHRDRLGDRWRGDRRPRRIGGAEIGRMSLTSERAIALGALGTLLAAVTAFAPLLWPYPLGAGWSLPAQAWVFLVDLLWVAAMVVTYRNEPAGPMWRLFLAYQVVGVLGVAWVFPTSLTWTLSQLSVGFRTVVFIHLLLAFPTGRLDRPLRPDPRGRWIRGRSGQQVGLGPGLASAPRPGRVLAAQPVRRSGRTVSSRGCSAPARSWSSPPCWASPRSSGCGATGATPPRRCDGRFCPSSPPPRFQLTITVAWHVAGVAPSEGTELRALLLHPVMGATGIVFPLGFLVGSLRARWARGGVADLAIELGRGVPLGGLRSTLARALRIPPGAGLPRPVGDRVRGPRWAGRSSLPETTSRERALVRLERDGRLLGDADLRPGDRP